VLDVKLCLGMGMSAAGYDFLPDDLIDIIIDDDEHPAL
jgi:hypothetical protein